MPDDDISRLSDLALIEAAGDASDERSRRHLDAEMWRRTTLIARRANLIAEARGPRAAMVGLWAIEVLLAVLLAGIVPSASDGLSSGSLAAPIAVLVLLLLVNTVALLVTANTFGVARDRLRALDAERHTDA